MSVEIGVPVLCFITDQISTRKTKNVTRTAPVPVPLHNGSRREHAPGSLPHGRGEGGKLLVELEYLLLSGAEQGPSGTSRQWHLSHLTNLAKGQ